MKATPVLLLTGYLGAGKTTLLNRILANTEGIKFAIIVNDIGEVNIDASLIARGGVVNTADDNLVPLQNGCICCTLQMDLVNQLSDLVAQQKYDYIVIEASGVCEPEPIARTIASMPAMGPEINRNGTVRLDCIATVVDALRLKSEFSSGESLRRSDLGEEDIENLIINQIEFCDIVLLNKISEVSQSEAGEIRSVIRALQSSAEIIGTDFCDVPLSRLLDTHRFDYEKVATSATWVKELEKAAEEHHHEHEEHEHHHDHDHEEGECHHHHHHHDHEGGETEEYGIGTYVYFRREPFSLASFDRFVGQEWPSNIIRAKGVCYFSENTDMSYLFEQAGVQKQLTEAGQWYATAPAEDLEAIMAREPGLVNDWDPVYGDRMQKIVFIGRNLDRADIDRRLDACLRKQPQ